MTEFHFGPLVRFIPASLAEAFARIVYNASRVFAKNDPVEISPDDPAKQSGYNKFWFVGRSAIIHSDPTVGSGIITYNGLTFSLPVANVLVAHVANGVLYFAVLGGSNQLSVYGIDLTGAVPSDSVQPPSDRIIHVFDVNASTGVVTAYLWEVSTASQFTYTFSVPTLGTRSILIPAFSLDANSFYYGYSNALTWIADAMLFTLQTVDRDSGELDSLRTNPAYPTNLTKNVTLDAVSSSTWDGARTPYGPANEPMPDTNSPGNVGQVPATQNYSIRLASHLYGAGAHVHATSTGHYWIAANTGTTSSSPTSTGIFFDVFPDSPKATATDGGVTWNYGGLWDGSPTGAYTYTDPISQEYTDTAVNSVGGTSGLTYGATLDDLVTLYESAGGPVGGESYYTFTLVDGPTAFSDQNYATVPLGWGVNPFDNVYINPLVQRVAKIQRDHYDASDTLIGTDYLYPMSFRDLMIYAYTNRTGIPTATLYPNGTTGISGQEPVGWCLNPDSGVVEQAYFEETSGANTTVTKTGSRPVNGQYYYWPDSLHIMTTNADAIADLDAHRPALSGGDYSYSVTGHTKIKRGFYVGAALQYEIYSGNENINNVCSLTGTSYTHLSTGSTNSGGTAVNTTEQAAVSQRIIATLTGGTNLYIQQKMENLQAGAYALVRFAESTWSSSDTHRSLTQTFLGILGGVENVVGSPFVMATNLTTSYPPSSLSGLFYENDIAPLDINGDCLFSVYWRYPDDYSGTGETVNPYVNQKLFTSSGEQIDSVDFGGTVVNLSDLNTAYPNSGADLFWLEVLG